MPSVCRGRQSRRRRACCAVRVNRGMMASARLASRASRALSALQKCSSRYGRTEFSQARRTRSSVSRSLRKWLGPMWALWSASCRLARSTTLATRARSGCLSLSHRLTSESMGGLSGKNAMKWNRRRRRAVSTSAIDRSAVFMVAMICRFAGRENGTSEYCSRISSSRYSSRNSSSPRTFDTLAPVEFVDQQDVGEVWPPGCDRGDPLERSVYDFVGHLAAREPGTVSLDEVLVGV